MRSPKVWLVAAAALFALGNLVVTFARSGIPYSLNGIVEDREVRREKHLGVDDVWLVTVDHRTYHLDAELGRNIVKRTRIEKKAFSARIQVDGRIHEIHTSRDFKGMLLGMPVLFLLGLLVSLSGRSPPALDP